MYERSLDPPLIEGDLEHVRFRDAKARFQRCIDRVLDQDLKNVKRDLPVPYHEDNDTPWLDVFSYGIRPDTAPHYDAALATITELHTDFTSEQRAVAAFLLYQSAMRYMDDNPDERPQVWERIVKEGNL